MLFIVVNQKIIVLDKQNDLVVLKIVFKIRHLHLFKTLTYYILKTLELNTMVSLEDGWFCQFVSVQQEKRQSMTIAIVEWLWNTSGMTSEPWQWKKEGKEGGGEYTLCQNLVVQLHRDS